MLKITKENLKDLKFDGVIIGVPSYVEVDQHKDIIFKTECSYFSNGEHGYQAKGQGADESSFYSVYYNTESLPNGLTFNATTRLTLENSFQFNSYDYYKFEDMKEFCEWYLQHKGMEIWSESGELKGKIREITPEEKPDVSIKSEDVSESKKQSVGFIEWYNSDTSKKMKRKDRLKEIREYVQQVMNIEYYKNFAIYKPDTDVETQKLSKKMAERLKQNLVIWLEEEV